MNWTLGKPAPVARLLWLTTAAWLWSCGGELQAPLAPAAPAVPQATPAYVGHSACAECHPQEAARWRGSHHDLAMQPATAETVRGDFDEAGFTYYGVSSSFYRQQGEYWVRTEGPGGELADYRVSHTFGVEPLQQYLVELPGGRLQALSLAWDARPAAHGGQRWFHLYPDEEITHDDALHWTGPLHNWNYMCAECHSTRLEKNYNLEQDRYDTVFAEIDVGCEACHGPGSRHVGWARQAAEGGDGDAVRGPGLVVELKDRDGAIWSFADDAVIAGRTSKRRSHREIELCAHCHSRRTFLADGHDPARPFLDDHRLALLDPGLYHADGQIDDEVYVYGSFLQSRMYREGVTCSDCHDPHSLTLRAPGNQVCATCHLVSHFDSPAHHHHPPEGPGAACVDCHMPQRTYMVVDPRRDHSFRVPRPDLTLKIATPNPCNSCHTDRSAVWAQDRLGEWFGNAREKPHYGEALHAGRRTSADAETLLVAAAEDPEVPGIARATALDLLRRYPSRRSVAAIELGLGDADPLVRLGALGGAEVLDGLGRLERVYPLLADPLRTVRTQAARLLAALPRNELSPDQRAEIDRVLVDYRAAQLANAERPEAHLNLGVLSLDRGELSAAQADYETALRLDPAFAPAYVNLADLYRLQGRDDQGEKLLREAVERLPDDAGLHHSLGLLLVRRQRLAEALQPLGRAVQVQPQNARYAYVYAVALNSSGDTDGALTVLESAHREHPGDRNVLTGLTTFHRQKGNVKQALVYAEKLLRLAPEDAALRQLLADLQAEL